MNGAGNRPRAAAPTTKEARTPTRSVPRDPRPSRPAAGLTLVEAVVGLGMLFLSLAGFARVVLFAGMHPGADREHALVRDAARRTLDELHRAKFTDAYALYNEDPFDDPGGMDTAPGDRVFVPGLSSSPNGTGGDPIGRIHFPTAFDFDAGLQLREDVLDPHLGMPRDLNGDGRVDHRDHAADYALLPVRVRFEWTGDAGPSSFEVETLLGEY